jgi:hypothetical protein
MKILEVHPRQRASGNHLPSKRKKVISEITTVSKVADSGDEEEEEAGVEEDVQGTSKDAPITTIVTDVPILKIVTSITIIRTIISIEITEVASGVHSRTDIMVRPKATMGVPKERTTMNILSGHPHPLALFGRQERKEQRSRRKLERKYQE